MNPILVTGATGNVGAEVVKDLAASDFPVRAAVRNPETYQGPDGAVEAIRFDFQDQSTHGPALDGVKKIFLVRPPTLANAKRDFNPFIDAAVAAGVEQIVFLSLQGVENNRVVPHHAIEEYVRASGIPYTFLRAGFFMQNLDTAHRAEIRDDSEIFVPAGSGTTGFIDVRDIAAVGAKALTEAGHENQAYVLTGEEALTYYDVAEILTKELERPIAYNNPSLLAFFNRRRRAGDALSYIFVMSGIYTVALLGKAGGLTDEVRRLLGRPAITMAEYAHDYRAAWL